MCDATSHSYRFMYSHTKGQHRLTDVMGLTTAIAYVLWNDTARTPALCSVFTNCDLENVYVTDLFIVITTSGLFDNCLKTCDRHSITATLVSIGVVTCYVFKMKHSRRQTAYLKYVTEWYNKRNGNKCVK